MASVKSIALLGLAAVAAASPVLSPEEHPTTLLPRQDEVQVNFTDPDAMCESSSNVDEDTAKQIWNSRGVGAFLDVYLESSIDPPGKDWVQKLAKFAKGDAAGDLAADGCGKPDGTCELVQGTEECRKMVAEGKGQAYWALRAAARLQDQMKSLQTKLIANTLSASLDVTEIADDFARPRNVELADGVADGLGMLALAFGFLGKLGGPISGAVAAAIFETSYIVRLNGDSVNAREGGAADVQPKDLDAVLQATFNGTLKGIERQLALATGALSTDPDRREDEGEKKDDPNNPFSEEAFQGLLENADPSSLPELGLRPGMGGSYDNSISRFFADGVWLLDQSDSALEDAFDTVYSKMSQLLVDSALNQTYFRVIADPHYHCNSEHAYYQEDFKTCLILMKAQLSNANCGNDEKHQWGDDCRWTWPSKEKDEDKLTEKYGFDIEGYMRNAYLCAESGGRGAEGTWDPTDVAGMSSEPAFPPCAFQITARNSTILSWYGTKHDDPYFTVYWTCDDECWDEFV